ncbi:sensor histidine kinase [Ferrovibrio sp.]|uniref:sensor histidine kinase n=2 Tax=Ferrovibrio sp. TaxID=1917215 RepID=UPI0035151456
MSDTAKSAPTVSGPAASGPAASDQGTVGSGFRRILPVNALVTVMVAGTTGLLLLSQLPPAWIWIWLACHAGPALYIVFRWLLRPRPSSRSRQILLRATDILIAGLSGLVWGAGALFLPHLDPPHQVLIIIVAGGMIAGSSATLAVVPVSALAYMVAAAAPYIAALLMTGTPVGYGLAVLASAFTLAMLVTNRIVNGVIRRNRRLFDENAALYARIRSAQDELLDIAESSEAFVFFDEAGRIQLWNRRLPALLGIGEDQLRRDAALPPLLDAAGLPADLPGQLAAAGSNAPRPVLRLPGGRWVRASLRRTPQGDRALILVDITEQQLSGSRLREQNERLEELFRQVSEARDAALRASHAKSTFLANMSHELRTPLNAIIGFSDIMQQKMFGEASPKYDEYLRDIHGSARHLLGIIDDILDLARIEASQIVLNETPVAIAEEAATCIRLTALQFGRPAASMLTSLPDGLPDLLADARLLRQILLNLIGNALKFSPAGAPIEIGALCNPAGEIELWVRDHGIGIAEADQARIFDPFEQADSQLSRKFGGVGLGLSLVRAFVAAHGGRIAVDSRPGQGSRISAIFPAMRTLARPSGSRLSGGGPPG